MKNFLTVLPIVISVVAVVVSFWSASKSNESAKLSQKIEVDNLSYQIDQTSLNYLSNAYDELFYKPENSYVLHLIKENVYVNDVDAFRKVIDVFEGVGSNFCQGSVKKKHIQPYLSNSLRYVCDNAQMNTTYQQGFKNGIAILCKEFYPDSDFAKKIDMTNVGNCTFFDSGTFKNNPNLEKYLFPEMDSL